MSEQHAPGPPGGRDANEILWVLLRDLSILSRAQARLMGDLASMIERMHREAVAVGPVGDATAPAGTPTRPSVEPPADSSVQPPTAPSVEASIVSTEPGVQTSLPSETETQPVQSIEEETQPQGSNDAETSPLAAGTAMSAEETAPVPPPIPSAPKSDEEPDINVQIAAVPDAPMSVDERTVLLEEEEGVEGNGKRLAGSEASISIEAEPDRDGAAEGPDDLDESVNEEAAVLILESEDARVGVLWDHVIQIGSLGSAAIPAKVETERGAVELVSLGLLLHGVSREEKYFVVLEQDGERAAVACERMLGVGPLGAAIQQERGARIQVLRVPVLRTFAASASPNGSNGGSIEDQKAADERDRNGPLRALVAVRYLPARVAICRHLRGRGWQVGEAAGLEAATVSLDLGRWDLLFLEAHGNGESEATEGMLLRRVSERDVPVIRVGSRISGFPGREGPALMFPFSESELDGILTEKRGRRNP